MFRTIPSSSVLRFSRSSLGSQVSSISMSMKSLVTLIKYLMLSSVGSLSLISKEKITVKVPSEPDGFQLSAALTVTEEPGIKPEICMFPLSPSIEGLFQFDLHQPMFTSPSQTYHLNSLGSLGVLIP